MPSRVLLDGLNFTVADGPDGSPRVSKAQRPSQPADAGELQYAEWKLDGHDFNSFEVIPAGGLAGFLGRDYGEGTDGRWWGLDCLGPKINTITLSTFDTDSDIVRDANCSAVAYAVWATAYQYVGRGTRPAKIDLSDMTLKDTGASLPLNVSDLIVTVAEDSDSFAVDGSLTDLTALNGAGPMAISPDGNYLFVTRVGGLVSVDISDPSNPAIVDDLAIAGQAGGLAISDDGLTLYHTTTATDTFSVIDASDPASLSVTGTLTDATNLDFPAGVAVSTDGDYVYVAALNADRLTVVDVTTPASPSVAGSVQDGTNLNGAAGVAVSGTTVYVTGSAGDSLAVVDASTPATPSVTGTLIDATNLDAAVRVAVSQDGNYVYVAASSADKFSVVDVQTPATPTLEGSVAITGAYAVAVSASGTRAYVFAVGGVISIVNVSTPASPTVVGSISSADLLAGSAGDIVVNPTTGSLVADSSGTASVVILEASSLEVSAGQGDVAPYYVLPVADIANPDDSGVDDGWVANDDSEAAKTFGLSSLSTVGMAKNVIKQNILTGSTTMKAPNWLTTATITGQKSNLTSTGFAMDGNLWVIGTNDGPYMLDSLTREFWPILPELDLSDENCRNLANWFALGVVMPLQYSLRWQKGGSGESFGEEEFKQNTSPVQGTPTAWTASAREGFEIRYNEEEGDAYLVAWQPREAGDQHGEIMSPYVIAKFTDTQSRFLEWVGTVDGIRTNPTLTGAYGSNYFWLTGGRTARWIDDANYRYTASGTTYLTEMRRLRNVLADVEKAELEVRRSDNGALDASKSVTVQLAFDAGIASGTYNTIGAAITSAGYKRLTASSAGVPSATFHGVSRIKPRIQFATDVDTVSPQVIGPLRVYYRTRPEQIDMMTYTFVLSGDNGWGTPEEEEEKLREFAGTDADNTQSDPVQFQTIDNETVYVRVTNVGIPQLEAVGQGKDSNRGTRRVVTVTFESWTT